MTHKALIRQLEISCLGLDPIDPLRLLVDDVIAALAKQEQEPVAMWDGKYQIEFGNLSAYKHGEHSWIPLYTTPPQRTWVGLTDEEYDEIWRLDLNNKDIMDRTIAKLKQKNTHD